MLAMKVMWCGPPTGSGIRVDASTVCVKSAGRLLIFSGNDDAGELQARPPADADRDGAVGHRRGRPAPRAGLGGLRAAHAAVAATALWRGGAEERAGAARAARRTDRLFQGRSRPPRRDRMARLRYAIPAKGLERAAEDPGR